MQRARDREARFQRYLQFGAMVKGGSIEPHWLPDGSFWYADTTPDGRIIYRVDPARRSRRPFFDIDRLRLALEEHLGYRPVSNGVPFEDFQISSDGQHVSFHLDARQLTLDLDTYTIVEPAFPPSESEKARGDVRMVRRAFQVGDPDIWESKSPNGRWIAGEADGNLTIRSTVDGRARPLTTDGTPDHPWQVASVRWSPDSSRLIAARVDFSGVKKLPIVHWLEQYEDVEWEYYPKTGGALPQTEVFVVDVLSGRATRIDTGPERDQMLFPAFWTLDGSEIHILKLGRTMKPVSLLGADPDTGRTRVILAEEVDGYLPQTNLDEPQENLYTPLLDGRFIWLSARTGWSHLYLHERDGTLIRPLTSGTFPVLQVAAVDEPGGWVYFLANGEERLYDTNLYRVDLDGNRLERLTHGTGQHEVIFSPDRQYFIDTYSSPSRPPVVELRSASGELIEELSRADISELEDLGWRPPEEFTALAADGVTELYGLLYLPNDLDPGRKYPVVEYIYGGPQVINVPHTFGTGRGRRAFPRALSQLGFAVVIVDGRGTRGRSQAFHAHSYGNFGQSVIPDHVAVLEQLGTSRRYLDMSRVGILGHSWGGYNALRAMLLAPDTYTAGVASNPVVDMEDHFAEWAESVMGLPQENPAGYEQASNLRDAGRLQGRLLLIHATSDTNATLSATIKMVNALIDAGKPYDLILLPEENHHPAGTREGYWVEAVRRYLVEHLKSEEA